MPNGDIIITIKMGVICLPRMTERLIMNIFICPICKKTLEKSGNSFVCSGRHTFDTAKSGYVNLLPASKMNSKTPGDGKEMVVSRRDFLDRGYYSELRICLADKAGSLGGEVYFDAGCGTGYYTSAVADALGECEVFGVDISKFAADIAAKREKRGLFAVASVYDLPVADSSVDIITNVFSPMADSEYCRILKKGGHLLYVVPGPRHLYSLKELLYETPYENPVSYPEYEGFKEIDRTECSFDIRLASSEDIELLFTMTPYFWRTPAGALEKIRALDALDTSPQFYISVLEKQ